MDPVPPDQTSTPAIPLACNLLAIDPAHRLTHLTAGSVLFQTMVQESHALPDGLAFRFAADVYDEVTAFIAQERRCCPFFHFQLDVAPDSGPLWLRITGASGVKAVLIAGLEGMLAPTESPRSSAGDIQR